MGKAGPETRLIKKMRDAGQAKYGKRLVLVKQHGSAYSEAGVSDLLGTLDGAFIAIEVKSPDTRHGVTVKQQAFIDRVLRAGGIAAVCDSVEGFLETLDSVSFFTNVPEV